MDGKPNDSQLLGEHAEGEEARRKRGRPAQPHCCQVCGRDLEVEGSRYHKRYRICPPHMMADSLVLDGVVQRFCQQCGRFHSLEAFEGTKRSCREQLEKQALRRRLARRAAATRSQGPAEQSGGSPAAYSGSSGADRSGEHAPRLQQRVQAEHLFEAVEARAAAAATAPPPPPPPPPPWLAGPLPPRAVSAAEQLAALLLQQQQTQQLAAAAATAGPPPDGQTPPSQQQLLQQYGSDQSQHSLMALARAMSASTAAPLPSPVAPITPASAEDLAQTPQQQAAAALLPALAQPGLSQLLQALLALAPVQPLPPQLPSPVQQPAPSPMPLQQPALPPLPAVPALPLQPLHPLAAPALPLPPLAPQLLPPLAAQQTAPGPYTQQLMNQMLSLNQQRVLAQQRAQRSEEELAALVRAVVQFLTALSGAPPAPPTS